MEAKTLKRQDYVAGHDCVPQLGSLDLDPKDWMMWRCGIC